MTLGFPNESRAYDATLRAIRFWGHDGAMEASFFVNRDALQRIDPGMRFDEEAVLRVFDVHRDLINVVAPRCTSVGVKVITNLYLMISSRQLDARKADARGYLSSAPPPSLTEPLQG
jgi:Protein of unknown function (DUF1488)